MKKKKFKLIYFLIPSMTIIIFIIIYIFFNVSSAIYYTKDEYDYSVSSAQMYISSNILEEDNTTMQMLNYDYSKMFFTVNNYESDSQISTININYSISCSVNPSNYTCYIDNTANQLSNQALNKSYECSISGYTEEQCKNDSAATLTYNKVTNNHSIYVKKTSGSDQSSVTAIITLTTTSPYATTLTRTLSLTFDNNRKGVVIEKIGENDFQCEYLITNYKDTNSLCFSARANSNIKFMDNNSNQLCLNIDKYSNKTIKTFKKKTESCTDGISLVQS